MFKTIVIDIDDDGSTVTVIDNPLHSLLPSIETTDLSDLADNGVTVARSREVTSDEASALVRAEVRKSLASERDLPEGPRQSRAGD